MDDLYNKFNKDKKFNKLSIKNVLSIILREQIFINKKGLPRILINFLRDNLNFYNSEYLIKKKIGVSTYGMERYFKLIQDNQGYIALPRGFIGKLLDFLNENSIKFEIINECKKFDPIKIESSVKLFSYQKEAIDNMLLSENGILVAPSGSGKTIMGIDLIARIKQPALILVHKKQIFNQWLERIESFLNIPKREIGQFASNKKKAGDKVTVAMIQTLNKMQNHNDIANKFGIIVIDECHHVPAKMFRNVITKFNPYYLYGLTATPERKNNDEKLIFIYLGDILYEVGKNYLNKRNDVVENLKVKTFDNKTNIIIRETEL